MKEKLTIFFAQYFLYGVLLLVIIYFLILPGLLIPLIFTGVFSCVSVFVARMLKYFFAKNRREGPHLIITKNKYAFPSSHAAGLSSIVLSTFGNYLWLFLLGATVIILLARVKIGVHDYKDIAAGVLTGLIVTALCIGVLALSLSL
jgi:membrane-associated phospholipid phosphatase